jgi:hypothetical protein
MILGTLMLRNADEKENMSVYQYRRPPVFMGALWVTLDQLYLE